MRCLSALEEQRIFPKKKSESEGENDSLKLENQCCEDNILDMVKLLVLKLFACRAAPVSL